MSRVTVPDGFSKIHRLFVGCSTVDIYFTLIFIENFYDPPAH